MTQDKRNLLYQTFQSVADVPAFWGVAPSFRSDLDFCTTLLRSFWIFRIISIVSTVFDALETPGVPIESSTFFFNDWRMATSSDRAESKEAAGSFRLAARLLLDELLSCFEN